MGTRAKPGPPLISVVIPAYNRADRIRTALDGVREQTCTHWEAIVVDDASTDETCKVVERYVEKDPRIRLVKHSENRRAQAARNTGIRAAKGEWIAFLDSDDRMLPRSLERRLEAALREGADVVHSEYCVIDDNAAMRLKHVRPLVGNIYRELLRRPAPGFPALLVKKTALEYIGLLDEKILRFQEWDTSIRLARHFKFAYVDDPTFIYDRRGDDAMSKARQTTGHAYEQLVRKHLGAILRYVGPGALATHFYVAGRSYWTAKQRCQAVRCWGLFGLYALLNPIWMCATFAQVLRSGHRDSLRSGLPRPRKRRRFEEQDWFDPKRWV